MALNHFSSSQNGSLSFSSSFSVCVQASLASTMSKFTCTKGNSNNYNQRKKESKCYFCKKANKQQNELCRKAGKWMYMKGGETDWNELKKPECVCERGRDEEYSKIWNEFHCKWSSGH